MSDRWSDICWYCNGTGDRDPFSGAPCHECNGTGWIEEKDPPWMEMSLDELAEYEQQMDEIYGREEPEVES